MPASAEMQLAATAAVVTLRIREVVVIVLKRWCFCFSPLISFLGWASDALPVSRALRPPPCGKTWYV
jgi:hypothetical protein